LIDPALIRGLKIHEGQGDFGFGLLLRRRGVDCRCRGGQIRILLQPGWRRIGPVDQFAIQMQEGEGLGIVHGHPTGKKPDELITGERLQHPFECALTGHIVLPLGLVARPTMEPATLTVVETPGESRPGSQRLPATQWPRFSAT